MDKPKKLSGFELVALGVLKRDSSLPEIGLKDVVPNGSWLEQKQIQSALEARKHLIEVQRIEKCGTLSHAHWSEDLMLAEVTQNTGGHWQYMGHNIGKQLYLNPEEALFLIEVNCLQLKYNGVTVSLQQAYSLLLRSKIGLLPYKVYASLSRLGYKIFRHEENTAIETGSDKNVVSEEKELVTEMETETSSDFCEEKQTDKSADMEVDSVGINESNGALNTTADNNTISENNLDEPVCFNMENNKTNTVTSDSVQKENVEEVTDNIPMKSNLTNGTNLRTDKLVSEPALSAIPVSYLQSLENRKSKPFNAKHTDNCFEQVPDLTVNKIVTLRAPKEDYIPRNVFLNNVTYVLNLEAISSNRKQQADSVERRSYGANEEVNGDHVRRIRGSFSGYNCPPLNFRPNIQFRPNFWRANTMNFFPFNAFFQRPFLNLQTPRFNNFFPQPSLLGIGPRFTNFSQSIGGINGADNTRKRKNNRRTNPKQVHLEAIKNLAQRIKQLVQSGFIETKNISALQKLILTFNQSYNMRLKITSDYEVINDENIVETIALDDEESSSKKKSRNEEDYNYTDNLNRLKQMALKLKGLDSKGEINSRHRRAFSNLIKRFNKSYNAEIYMNSTFEIMDKRFISLDSSSDSDCVMEEAPKVTKGKKLKNPFSVLKRLQDKNIPSVQNETIHRKYTTAIKENFGSNWLPSEEEFGRAEVLPNSLTIYYLINVRKQEFLLDFMKDQNIEFDNWLEVKKAFYRNVEDTYTISTMSIDEEENSLKSLIGPNDSTDTPSILKKLRIIGTDNKNDRKSSLAIDFDVYNRDVQNFRKTNRPKPHFRIVCISESSSVPTGKDVAALHSKYDDNIPIVFAIVGLGSISYLQINPNVTQVYLGNNDFS